MHALRISSWLFLALVALGLPYAALATARRTRSAEGPAAIASRVQLHWNAIATQLLMFGIAWYAGALQGLRFLGPVDLTPYDTLAGAAAVACMSLMALVSRAIRSDDERRRMWVLGFLPRTWREGASFTLLAAVAAVSEELVYRGVAFTMFTMLTGSAMAGAAISAVAFAGAHAPQGGKSMGVIFVIGLIKQTLVVATHTLWVAIVVHFLYNVSTALRLAGRARAAGSPTPPA